MFLKGNNIQLRALEPSDANLLYRWENDRSLWPVSFTQIPFSKFILEDFVNTAHQDIYTNKQLRLMAESLETKSTIGIVDLYEFDPQHARCGLGIFISEIYRGKGSALECVELVKEYCFNTLHLKQLFVHVNNSNSASIALFEKAKFEKSGLKKSWHKTGLNIYEDVWFLQCINSVD
jgi:diamine N-acetyltransferase